MTKAKKINVRPLGDRVVIKPMEAEERTAGGIVLPDTAKEKPQKGTVVAFGPGKTLEDGGVGEMSIKTGDMVLFAKYGGTAITIDGDEYQIMREADILAIIE